MDSSPFSFDSTWRKKCSALIPVNPSGFQVCGGHRACGRTLLVLSLCPSETLSTLILAFEALMLDAFPSTS